jgi:hypothetical protein
MKSPAIVEKYKQGPVGFITILPSGPPAMPKFLIQWFIYCLLIGFFVAYLTGHTIALRRQLSSRLSCRRHRRVPRLRSGNLSNGIWKGQTWSATIKEVVDGLIYALLTAGTFGWLWPR